MSNEPEWVYFINDQYYSEQHGVTVERDRAVCTDYRKAGIIFRHLRSKAVGTLKVYKRQANVIDERRFDVTEEFSG